MSGGVDPFEVKSVCQLLANLEDSISRYILYKSVFNIIYYIFNIV